MQIVGGGTGVKWWGGGRCRKGWLVGDKPPTSRLYLLMASVRGEGVIGDIDELRGVDILWDYSMSHPPLRIVWPRGHWREVVRRSVVIDYYRERH
jgi:hypothetical protein